MFDVALVTGGQTGVDRAALDAALALGVPVTGWCPRGRWAEDGPLAPHYPLRETPSPDYAERTRWNVRDSDATLLLTHGAPAGGTALTLAEAHRLQKPALVIDLQDGAKEKAAIQTWITAHRIRILNVAGPRESEAPGIYAAARTLLERLFDPNG